MRNRKSFFTTLLVLSSCCTLQSSPSHDLPQPTIFQATSDHSPKGVFIVVHGLNQQPETMEPIAVHLRSLGYHTYRLTLRGHETPEHGTFQASEWKHDVRAALSRTKLQYPQLPIHIFAYSLGGLITTKVLDESVDIAPASVILLAPALSLRVLPQSGYLLTALPALTIAVPNISPRYYRRFSRTPLFWYQNTFDLYSETRSMRSASNLAAIPTLVIANPRDELISFTGLRDWLEDNQLDHSWSLAVLRPRPHDPLMPEHVMIDPISLGADEWKNLKGLIREFLEK